MSKPVMNSMPNEILVRELISVSSLIGCFIGEGERDTPGYKQAIAQCQFLRQHVLLRLKGTCGLACHMDPALEHIPHANDIIEAIEAP